MNDIENYLSPLTMRDVHGVLRVCRRHKRRGAFLNVGSKRSFDILNEILSGKPNIRRRIYSEIKRLGVKKTRCLLQLMLLGQPGRMSLNAARVAAASFDAAGMAGYMSEKTTLYLFLKRGIARLERGTE